MSKSIRNKVIKNFLVVIISTILILDILMIVSLKQHYYKNRETFLINQVESSISFYNKYFSEQTLIENIYDNVDDFWSNTNTQVEILDSNGNLLMDSIGIRNEKILTTPDIDNAINGNIGRWIGDVDYYHGRVMIVSYPMVVNDELIGIMRVISSLEDIDNTFDSFIMLFLIISGIVIAIGIILSLIMAKAIIEPIKSVTKVANKMATGDLSVRSNIEGSREIEQLSNTLNYMASEVEKREKLKNEFISSVSHELRTPLTAIKGWAVTLDNEETDKETLKIGFDIIVQETDRLSGMVEELLDFSKLINGIVTLNKEEVNIEEFTEHIEQLMTPRANREEISFSVEVNNINVKSYFDYNKIKQVLINILDNAFKFTNNRGSIKLKVNVNKDDTIFIITDTGCGISEYDLPKVKEKFYKGKNSKSKNGIGLSICDEIIKLHNGKFEIESEVDKGTKVIINIPNNKGVL